VIGPPKQNQSFFKEKKKKKKEKKEREVLGKSFWEGEEGSRSLTAARRGSFKVFNCSPALHIRDIELRTL